MKRYTAVFSPIIIIGTGYLTALLFSRFINEWVFIPLAFIYWLTLFTISFNRLGWDGIKDMFKKPQGKIGWLILSVIVGLIPLSIFLLNLNLLTNYVVVALWIAFALINPFFEQLFWRGYMLRDLMFPTAVKVAYSTFFFVAIHPLVWGVFSIANRSWMTWLSLSVMGVVWCVVYLKTKSLWWCIISHFMVDIFNLSVFVFLNMYVPPVM